MQKSHDFYQKLGWALRSQRQAKKIPIEVIANELGISYQQIQKYETGENRIPVDKLTIYCDLLKVKPQWILSWVQGRDFSA